MWGFSYWVFPLVSALMWLATILTLLITWNVQGHPHYASMDPTQTIAFISDVGAEGLKPLFIAGSVVTVVMLDVAMIAERWLRHRGRLAPNTSRGQEVLSVLAILAGVAGAAGLILLSIFDTLRHPRLHDIFLIVFIGGYVISAVFICAEYQRLGIKYRKHVVLRTSFWMKLSFILIELALAIPFGVLNTASKQFNVAACLEWGIAFIFTFYVLTFFLDLIPAIRTKHNEFDLEAPMTEMGATDGADVDVAHGEHTNGNIGNASTGHYGGVHDVNGAKIPPSQNF